MVSFKEAAKTLFFSGPATKRGGGGIGLAAKKKVLFRSLKKNVHLKKVATKLEPVNEKKTFFAASQTNSYLYSSYRQTLHMISLWVFIFY